MYIPSPLPAILSAEVILIMIEENRNFESKPRDFLRKQGFYIVLFVCLLIVGTAIVLTSLPADGQDAAPQTGQSEPQQQQQQQQQSLLETRQSGDETLYAKNTPLPTATPQPTTAPQPTKAPKASASAGRVNKGSAPVKGEVIWGYADTHLLYSRTLDQWTTHAGVDLSSEVGASVAATLAGTVERVYEDDALGTVVTIAHNNNRLSLYGNLDPTVSVKEGQKVNAGDPIGKVGTSAVSECGDLPHVHFGFFVSGKPVNPMDYVTIPH